MAIPVTFTIIIFFLMRRRLVKKLEIKAGSDKGVAA